MKEHKHAQYLRALADGKVVQVRNGSEWIAVTVFNAALVQLVSGNDTGWRFRIAPETISITLQNGEVRTINAPLREAPENDAIVWFSNAQGDVTNLSFSDAFPTHATASRCGLLFASKEDAQAWVDLQREILGVKS